MRNGEVEGSYGEGGERGVWRTRKRGFYPRVIGHEEVIVSMLAQVNEVINESNKCMTALNARRRLRTGVSVNA